MTVDGGASAVWLELEVDAPDPAPLEEGFFDGFALGVAADGAASLVMRDVDFGLGFGPGLFGRGGGTQSNLFKCWNRPGFSFWPLLFVMRAFWCGCCATFDLRAGLSVNLRGRPGGQD